MFVGEYIGNGKRVEKGKKGRRKGRREGSEECSGVETN